MYLGERKIDGTLVFPATTTNTGGTPTDADSAPTYKVIEDETSTAILTGSLAKLGSETGVYTEQITLSVANGFEWGKSYTIIMEATVGGVSGKALHSFSIPIPAGAVMATISGTPTTTAFDTDLTDADDTYNGAFCVILTGNRANQSRKISDFANTNGVITLATALANGAPASGDRIMVIGRSE